MNSINVSVMEKVNVPINVWMEEIQDVRAQMVMIPSITLDIYHSLLETVYDE